LAQIIRLLSYTAREPTKQGHGFGGKAANAAENRGAELMKEAQEEVAEGRQGLGSLAGAAGVLGQDGVAFVMKDVLDGPVTTADEGQGGGIRLSRA
jgi:hypothetical protein